jgi:hypothetical protein
LGRGAHRVFRFADWRADFPALLEATRSPLITGGHAIKSRVASIAVCLAVLTAPPCFAQQTPTDVQKQLDGQGYTQVHDIKATPEGTSAKAIKDGKEWTVVVDSQGKVVKKE